MSKKELYNLLLEACPHVEGRKPSIARLAKEIGITYQYVYRWIDEVRVPAKFVRGIVKASEGRVTVDDLIDYVI